MSLLQTQWKGKKLFKFEMTALLVALCTVALVLTPLAEASGLRSSNSHKVIIKADGKTQEVLTKHTKLHSILHQAGVTLAHHDEIRSSTPHVTDGTVINVYRAVHVKLEANGTVHEYLSGKPTVGELMEAHGYSLVRYAAANAEITDALKEGMVIKVETVEEHEKRKAEEARLAEEKRLAEMKKGPDYVDTEEGPLRFVEHYVMEGSAYLPTDGSDTGTTAMGIPARWGIVAVDPDVIALGTRVYVPGYGVALAADTGGMIEGLMIDLCMEDYDQAMEFGRRDIDVYVLADN